MINMRLLQHANPWRFFALAFALSWLFWIPTALLGKDAMTFPLIVLFIAGAAGPALAEIILIFHSGDKQQRSDYQQRVFGIRRISGKWHLVIWLTFPVLSAIAILLSVLTGGTQPEFETAKCMLSEPWAIIPFAIFILIFGPLPEELGWRGYTLDGLQARWNALTSSLFLGVMWALWHFPLFFMKGTFQNEMGFGTLNFWSFCLGPIVSSILFTWIYNNNKRSTLSAILFHFMINFSGEPFSLTEQARFYQLILLIVVAVSVTIIWGPKTLTLLKR